MPGKTSTKDKSMAKYLKERYIERTTGACPWGCGRQLANGGQHLLVHLNTCKGSSKKARR